ncbi:MAG: ABC transporter ATP-binding protein [Firmicutes bacterium]|nr:ABC transporter ATP-binding protein [Bacillota bacterium]
MLKKLAGCIREYAWLTALSPLFMIGEVALEVLIPYHMADLVDLGIQAGDMTVIRSVGMRLILLAFASMLCGVLGAVTSSTASSGFAANLRHDMYYNIQRFSFSNIDKFSASGLVTRMTTDVTNVQMAFAMLMRMAVRAPASIILAMIAARRINKRLSLVFLYVLPVLAVGLFMIMRKALPLFERMFRIYDRLNNTVQENVRGIRVVKAFVREEKENEKFGEVADDLYRTSFGAERIMALNGPLMQTCSYSCMLLIAWLGAKLIVSGSMTTGQLISINTYVMQILMSLMMLSFMLSMSSIAIAAAKRISEVLMEEPDIESPEEPVPGPADGSVAFEDVDFGYGSSLDCINDIDLKIASGETIGILGGTGSGKTSLVQLIPRLYDARKGRVLVGGTDVRELDLTALRKSVSMVLQKNVLFSGTVADNLRWGNEGATDEELLQALDHAQAKGFVLEKEGGLYGRVEQGGSNFSGGQRQRLCIARALVSKPKILILDDSTSAVDTHTESLIRKAFREDLPDTTKIIIAQRISSVRDADRIVVLDNGRISGVGTHDQLMASNAIYREVYDSQTKGGDFDAAE